jgi:hypothetical protein
MSIARAAGIRSVLPALLLLLARTSSASWPSNPAVNVPLCTVNRNQVLVSSIPDGSGGAIMTWQDDRVGTKDIYAQRVNGAGVAQWPSGGLAVCTMYNHQYTPAIVSDGAGGAIIAWEDHRDDRWQVYAQRIDATGAARWTPDGVALSPLTDGQSLVKLATDGAGGAIATWQDSRGDSVDVYAQRVDAAGVVQWPVSGRAVCTAGNAQYAPQLVSDGGHGAIIVWEDLRGGLEFDLYAQRLNGAGLPQWAANGIAISTAADWQYHPSLAADGSGGVFVAWDDHRSSTQWQAFGQHLDATGGAIWAPGGQPLSTSPYGQYNVCAASDGQGGVITAWVDGRPGPAHLFAQRYRANGGRIWNSNDVSLAAPAATQTQPSLAPDGSGGAIVAWLDLRANEADVYAQRVGASGTPLWSANGVAVSSATGDQGSAAPVPDGAGGVIVSWEDTRSLIDSDIYAQNVSASGVLGGSTVAVAGDAQATRLCLRLTGPNPCHGSIALEFALPDAAAAVLEVFDASGRRLVSRSVTGFGAGRHTLTLAWDRTKQAPGICFVRLKRGADSVTAKAVLVR